MKSSMKQALALGAMMVSGSALAVPVDLSSWSLNGAGNWNVAGDNNSVTQTQNSNPGVFFGPGNAQGNQLSGTIRVNTTSDDDFIGFVLGYNNGDLTNTNSDFLLIDWKQGTQGAFSCTGAAGLAISHVSAGLASNAGAWCHSADFGVTELARGATLGNVGWNDLIEYTFDLVFNPTNVQVFVNGEKEIDIFGSFSDGSFGFYNYSQQNVSYGAIQQTVAPPPVNATVSEPATLALLGLGLAGIGMMRRRRQG